VYLRYVDFGADIRRKEAERKLKPSHDNHDERMLAE
jgi:hypothetical protein